MSERWKQPPRKATPDMDRAKVSRFLAESFEPEPRYKGAYRAEMYRICDAVSKKGFWYRPARDTSAGWQPRDFFTSPDLVLMCLEWLVHECNTHRNSTDRRDMLQYDGWINIGNSFRQVGNLINEVRPSYYTAKQMGLSEAIVLATAKAKGIER